MRQLSKKCWYCSFCETSNRTTNVTQKYCASMLFPRIFSDVRVAMLTKLFWSVLTCARTSVFCSLLSGAAEVFPMFNIHTRTKSSYFFLHFPCTMDMVPIIIDCVVHPNMLCSNKVMYGISTYPPLRDWPRKQSAYTDYDTSVQWLVELVSVLCVEFGLRITPLWTPIFPKCGHTPSVHWPKGISQTLAIPLSELE